MLISCHSPEIVEDVLFSGEFPVKLETRSQKMVADIWFALHYPEHRQTGMSKLTSYNPTGVIDRAIVYKVLTLTPAIWQATVQTLNPCGLSGGYDGYVRVELLCQII